MDWNPLGDCTAAQREQLAAFVSELARINRSVNLVAPGTIPHAEERHIIHSLALARHAFPDGTTVVDFGAGGGLPSVPLAIRFPAVQFTAVDAVRKKTEAVRLFARRLGLANLSVWNGRAEDWPGKAHYAVSRATAPLADLWGWFERARSPLAEVPDGAWLPGLLALKGGDLAEEIAALPEGLRVETTDLRALLWRAYFEDKVIVQVRAD